jgi:hypothetical protein
MSLNLHGNITENNYQEACQKTSKYGPLRVKLSLILINILNKLNLVTAIDSGTLMGAWRNGKMIPHDDDFDLVVYHPSLLDSHSLQDKEAYLEKLLQQIDPLLPKPYEVRVVTTYCQKLEIYDPTEGNYPFRDNNYHNVTCDLTLLLHKTPELLQFQHGSQQHIQIPTNVFLPLSTIEYEGHIYECPGSPEGYLQANYGYLGPNAVYDKKTGLYIKKED